MVSSVQRSRLTTRNAMYFESGQGSIHDFRTYVFYLCLLTVRNLEYQAQ